MDLSTFKEKVRNQQVIYFDEQDFLREKTCDRALLKCWIEEASLLATSHEKEKYTLYGIIGNFYRICEEPQNALLYLEQCLSIAKKEGDFQKQLVTYVRIGEALKYSGEYKKAATSFVTAFNLCETNALQAYADFIWQHRGKLHMECGQLEEATDCFSKALALRVQKKDPLLIDSTKQALRFVEKLK